MDDSKSKQELGRPLKVHGPEDPGSSTGENETRSRDLLIRAERAERIARNNNVVIKDADD